MHALTVYHVWVRRLTALLLGVVGVCVFLYGGLLLSATAHAAGAAKAQHEVRALQGEVAQLEGEYLAQNKALSPERAKALGFVTPASVESVYAQGSSLTLR